MSGADRTDAGEPAPDATPAADAGNAVPRGPALLDLKARWAMMDAKARLRAKQAGVAASVAVLGYGLYTAQHHHADAPAAPEASKLDMGAGLRGDSLELKLRGDIKKILDGQSLLGARVSAIEEGKVAPGGAPGAAGGPAGDGDLPSALPGSASGSPPAFPPAPDTSAVEPKGDTLPPPPASGPIAPPAPPAPPIEKTVGGIGAATPPLVPASASGGAAGPDAKNVWPTPSARVMLDDVLVCINVSGLRASALAEMDRARLGPHKDGGVEHHIFDQALAARGQPLRHLSFTSTDLVSDVGAVPAAVPGQAAMAA